MRSRILGFVVTVQSVLFLGHWFIYQTWTSFDHASDPPGISWLAIAIALLSITFVTASLLAWRYPQWPVRVYYTLAATWLGFFSYFLIAAGASWILYGFARTVRLSWQPRSIAFLLFGLALAAGIYGLLNAARVRVRRVPVKLANLPPSWRGRVAALVTDTHLGHVRGAGFSRKLVALLSRLRPDIVLIGGDLYDGTSANARRLAAPLQKLSAPLGAFFVTGNHEEFRNNAQYLEAIEGAGIRVLRNEKVVVDGLQLVGVYHHDSVFPERLRSILRGAQISPSAPSVLLTHAPNQLGIAAEEGISLQLSGHTHGGQYFPFTLVASRIYGAFVHGLHQLGNLLVYTSYGAGTWGPPLRVGTSPEIVLLRFE